MSDPIEAWQDAEWAPNDLSEPHDAGDALVSALEAALERCRQLEELEAALERIEDCGRCNRLEVALRTVRDELGVPNETYPAPVANAVTILRAALLPDREPQPGDGPEYHEDHAAWVRRQPQPEETLTHEEKVARYGTTYGNPMKSWHELDLAPEPEGEL